MQKKSKKEGKTLSIRHLLCTVIFFILGLPIYPVTGLPRIHFDARADAR